MTQSTLKTYNEFLSYSANKGTFQINVTIELYFELLDRKVDFKTLELLNENSDYLIEVYE